MNQPNRALIADVEYAFQIYKMPYKNSTNSEDELPRKTHGIQHVTRAVIYSSIFVNLYRRYGDIEALQ